VSIRNNSITFASYLAYLIPFALLTGSFLPDLFLSLIVIVHICITTYERNFIYYKNKFFIIFIFFWLYSTISSLISSNPLLSLESSLFYFRFGFFFLGIWFLLDENNRFFYLFKIIFTITLSFAILAGFYEYFIGENIIKSGCELHQRLCLPFNDKLVLGTYLSRLMPLLFAFFLLEKKQSKSQIILIFSLIFFSNLCILLSGERAAFFLNILFILLISLLIEKYKTLRIGLLFFTVLTIVIISSFNNPIKDRMINYTAEQLFADKKFENVDTIYFSREHDPIYFSAISMYLKNPVFGVGPKMFRELCNKEEYYYPGSCSTHPHNNYLQVMAETGTIGLLFLLIPGIYLLFNLLLHIKNSIYNSKKSNDFDLCILICLAITLWPLVPNQNFFNGWINIIYFLPVGFYLHSLYMRKLP